MHPPNDGSQQDRGKGTGPRFFDLQLNGYAGIDFNSDNLTSEDLHAVCEHLRDDEVEGILATVITDDLEKMTLRVRNLVAATRQSALASQLIRGIHLEGPFISAQPGYVGAHPAWAVRQTECDRDV